jgi:kynurenine formamidase
MQSLALCAVFLLTAGVWFVADGLPIDVKEDKDSKNITKGFVDMSYPYDNTTMYWPTMPRFELESVWKGTISPGGTWYQANKFCAAEHGGTHMDAPNHFQEGQWAINEIPFRRFIAPAVVLNIVDRASRDRDALVTVEDALAWEKEHGNIPKGAVILMYSGWGQYYNNRTAFFGNEDDPTNHHYPGFSPDLVSWVVKNRDVVGFGVDTPSTDHGPSQDFPAHKVLSANNLYGLEMVANLGDIPAAGATLYALPLKIKGGSGGPTRVFAVLP